MGEPVILPHHIYSGTSLTAFLYFLFLQQCSLFPVFPKSVRVCVFSFIDCFIASCSDPNAPWAGESSYFFALVFHRHCLFVINWKSFSSRLETTLQAPHGTHTQDHCVSRGRDRLFIPRSSMHHFFCLAHCVWTSRGKSNISIPNWSFLLAFLALTVHERRACVCVCMCANDLIRLKQQTMLQGLEGPGRPGFRLYGIQQNNGISIVCPMATGGKSWANRVCFCSFC